jgi:hypothetical protein
MKLRLASRRSPDARCAFCHDALGGVIATCPRCLTAFHRDCRGHLSKCPTLGCETAFTAAPEVELASEAPASLTNELLLERWYLLIVPIVGAIAAALVLKGDQASTGALVFAAVAAVWLGLTIARELAFVLRLRRVLASQPRTMQLEVRVEPYHEGRIYSARLTGSDRAIDLDLAPVLAAPPAWIFTLSPGTTVQVHALDRGPVAIRTLDGHSYAVPASRVRRVR